MSGQVRSSSSWHRGPGEAVSVSPLAYAAVGVVVGYLVGAINPATIIARARDLDLRASGSGNPGATNAGRVLGRRTGVVVGVLDVLKGVVPVLVFGWIAGPWVGELAGLAAVLGHITSPFLHGRGGKGVATTLGVLLVAQPLWLVPVLAAAVIVFVIVRRMGLASVAGAFVLVIVALLDRSDPWSSVFGVALGGLILVRHQSNLRQAWVAWRSRVHR